MNLEQTQNSTHNVDTAEATGQSVEGSTLLLVLGILSISLAMAMGYTFTVLTESTTSASHTDLIRSRELADSGLRQAIAMLRTVYNTADGNNDDHDYFPATSPTFPFYSPTSGPFAGRSYACSTSDDNNDVDYALSVTMGDFDFVPNKTMDISAPANATDDDRGFLAAVTDSRVIGRIAYMIIDESGKIDPNTAAMNSVSEATGSGTRTGDAENEICLEDGNLLNFNDYLLTTGERLYSMRQLAREVNPTDFETQAIKVLHPFSTHPETYWNDNNGDGNYSTGEIYNRLDVTSSTDMTIEKLYKAFIAPDDSDTALPDIGDLDGNNDCAWLKKLEADGNLATGTERRRVAAQVAATIVDAIDGDDTITTAWVNTNGNLTTTDPGAGSTESKVLGRENVYGVSELSVKIETEVLGGPGHQDLRIKVYFKGEIYFPSAENEPLGSHTLTVTYTLAAESSFSGAYTFFNSTNFAIPAASTVNEEGGTLRYSSGWMLAGTQTKTNFLIETSANEKYTITNFQIDSLTLNDGSGTIDSFPHESSSTYWWNWASTVDLIGNQTLFATLEAHDPQNNEQDEQSTSPTYGDCWRITPGGSSTLATTDAAVDIGALTNTSGIPSISEYGDTIVKDSAFTRVGELGRVGSYRPGRSLRFWAADVADETGSDTYLLDLFKVGNTGKKRGKINVNSMNSDVLNALLTNAVTVTPANASGAILAKRGLPTTFTNIGDFFNVAGLSGTNTSQDDIEEAMVEKLAELVTVRRNYFTIIVNAQSIHDIGGQYIYKDLNNDGDTYDAGEETLTTYGIYDHGGDKILRTTKVLAVAYRDAVTNEVVIEHFEYLN